MKYIYAFSILLSAIFLAIFIQQNGTAIQLHYFKWSTPFLPISLYMILCFAGGYVLAMVVGFATGIKFRFRASGTERELRQLRAELDHLKGEELKAVNEEFQSDPKEPPSQEDSRTDTDESSDGEPSQPEHDPDAKTAVSGSGEEEKERVGGS